MTTRQRTTANILLGAVALLLVLAALVSWRSYDATTAAATERADVTASELADAKAQIADLQATISGQHDVNAGYADQIADLKAKLKAKPKTVTKVVTKRVEVPVTKVVTKTQRVEVPAKAPTSSTDPLDVARGKAKTSTWEGFTVGEVIVCPKGWAASVDDTREGGSWAACM
jgi:hypothetical protein